MFYTCTHRGLYRYSKCVLLVDSRFCVERTQIFKTFSIINQQDALISQLYFGRKIYMFRTVPLSSSGVFHCTHGNRYLIRAGILKNISFCKCGRPEPVVNYQPLLGKRNSENVFCLQIGTLPTQNVQT
jgi:hypothetical protein